MLMTQNFPIDAIKAEFITALTQNNTLILTAPPGAGKSTRLPLWLLSLELFSSHKIYLLQPRRVAAKNIACYLSEQIGEKVGNTIGYRLKNESKVSKNTRLEVITEGILTQIIQHDPELVGCGLVILDEFHERSLQGDLAFALARDVQQALREDLKLVIMSATLATKELSDKLPNAVMLASEGRSFPVDVDYLPVVVVNRANQGRVSTKQWREHALRVVAQQTSVHNGSILVFLPGVADIKYLYQNLPQYMNDKALNTISLNPLYGELSIEEQQKAIAPTKLGERKLVLATNIAETSLTIEGVTLVIDCGFEKTATYDPKTLTSNLKQRVISKASAIQRAGRAGRLSVGKCLRLYGKDDFSRRDENSQSEIQQADLLPFVIEASRWGVSKLGDLPLIELPSKVKEKQAWQELHSLQIVNEHNQLTSHGDKVAALPCHPRFAHMIIMAYKLEKKHNVEGLLSLAGLVAALLEERDVFTQEHAQFNCNLIHRLDALLNKKLANHIAYRIVKQANNLVKRLNTNINISMHAKLPINDAGVLIALAYPERIAKYRNKTGSQAGEYATTAGKGINIHQEDALLGEPYIVAAQIGTSQTSNAYLGRVQPGLIQQNMTVQLAAPVDVEQLIEWEIVQITTDVKTLYDEQVDRIIAKKLTKIDALVINEVSSPEHLTNELIAQLWTLELTKQGVGFLTLKDKDHALLKRWHWLTLYSETIDLPNVDEKSLLDQVQTWFSPFVGEIKNKKQLDKCDFSTMFLSLLSYQQQQTLVHAAPEYFIGPTQRRCPIRYTDDRLPIVSLPMQELYGLTETPSVGGDITTGTKGYDKSIPLVLEILSPAKRPIQITHDLPGFWQGSYKAVQKDMKAQYPRHYWPDDPANAKATRKTKRHIIE